MKDAESRNRGVEIKIWMNRFEDDAVSQYDPTSRTTKVLARYFRGNSKDGVKLASLGGMSNLGPQDVGQQGVMTARHSILDGPSNGLKPDYRGIFVNATYEPGEEDSYSEYNWLFLVETDRGSTFILDPHNMSNRGPFYFGKGGGLSISEHSMFDATGVNSTTFFATMTLYGFNGDTSTQIGSVTYGYSYSNGVLNVSIPEIRYNGK